MSTQRTGEISGVQMDGDRPVESAMAPYADATGLDATGLDSTETEDAAGPGTDAVVVRLVGCRYAVGMSAVAEVGRLPQVTRVPGLPGWLAGVANWRGRVLAVVDLRALLGGSLSPVGSAGRLLVLRREALVVGLVTEGVEAVSERLDVDVEPSLATLPESAAALLAGQVTDAAGPMGVLDLDAVFALAGTLPRVRRAG